MLGEISQIEKDKYHMWNLKPVSTDNTLMVSSREVRDGQNGGWGMGDVVFQV